MAYYKSTTNVKQTTGSEFDAIHRPGDKVTYSGIYLGAMGAGAKYRTMRRCRCQLRTITNTQVRKEKSAGPLTFVLRRDPEVADIPLQTIHQAKGGLMRELLRCWKPI